MLRLSHARPFTFAVTLLLSGMLFAQRYQERDHTVFHRPAPPSAQKRQGAQPGNTAAAHHAANAATTTAHVRPAPLGNTQSGSDPHNPQPLTIPPSH